MEFERKLCLTGALQDIFRTTGIKHLLFDLDNTMVDTEDVYKKRMKQFAEDIARCSGQSFAGVYASMRDTLRGLIPQFSVHPALMQEAARITALSCGMGYYSAEVQQFTYELMQIYETAPAVFDGVHDALDVIQPAGVGLSIVTHADTPITFKKLAQNGLLHYFQKDHVFCIPPLGHKGVEEWRGVLAMVNATPDEVIIVGDSWTSDIKPALEMGVSPPHIFRVKTVYGNANQGRIDGITEIDAFRDLPEAILTIK